MVSRLFTINASNALRYGYDSATEATKYAGSSNERDFEDWGKVDETRPENAIHKNECTNDLISNWRRNIAKRRNIQDTRMKTKQRDKLAKQKYHSELTLLEPAVNIYLRPALTGDVPQMTDIYNHHIMNGCRPAEAEPIPKAVMRDRLLDAISSKLPFVVAVLRNSKSMISSDNNGGLQGLERVVGWAAAQDFTAADFVERISVELEIYVMPDYRQKGVGRCLMDQMLESLDRGHIKKGGYLFTCAQEIRHIYSPGGGRDIHKVLLVVRKYKHPRQLDPKKPVPKLDDREDDFDCWLRHWLSRSGFQLEGVLSGIGVKRGRFLDVAYMSRETMWQPTEGQIPEPLPGA